MPTDIWKIPLDSNGAVRGSYYLRHRTAVSDTLGTVHFVNGRSAEPVTGRPLMHFVAALGIDVDLEPADDEARAAMGVKPEPKAEAKPAAAPVDPPPSVGPVPATERTRELLTDEDARADLEGEPRPSKSGKHGKR